MNVFLFFITCKRTNNANNATHNVKLDKKRREISKRNYYIISSRVIIKAIIIAQIKSGLFPNKHQILYHAELKLHRRFDSGKNFKNRELKFIFEHIELPAKLLDYFLRSSKSNINQIRLTVSLCSSRR